MLTYNVSWLMEKEKEKSKSGFVWKTKSTNNNESDKTSAINIVHIFPRPTASTGFTDDVLESFELFFSKYRERVVLFTNIEICQQNKKYKNLNSTVSY